NSVRLARMRPTIASAASSCSPATPGQICSSNRGSGSWLLCPAAGVASSATQAAMPEKASTRNWDTIDRLPRREAEYPSISPGWQRGDSSQRVALPFLARLPLAFVRVEVALAQADALGGHFDQLVVLDVSDRLLQRHLARRGQANAFILAAGAEVGELLGLQRIDLEILRLGIFADDHALVELFAGADEQHAAVLQRVQRVSHRLALLHRDQHAVLPPA